MKKGLFIQATFIFLTFICGAGVFAAPPNDNYQDAFDEYEAQPKRANN